MTTILTQGSKWMIVIDLKEALYHIEEGDKSKTAFEVEGVVEHHGYGV